MGIKQTLQGSAIFTCSFPEFIFENWVIAHVGFSLVQGYIVSFFFSLLVFLPSKLCSLAGKSQRTEQVANFKNII